VANFVSTAWNALLAGVPGNDFEAEHKRRFLAGLLAILIPFGAIFGWGVLPRWLAPATPYATATFEAAAVFVTGLTLAFTFNRRGGYRHAAWITIVSVLVATYWASFDHPQTVIFVNIAVIVATALFPSRGATAVGVAGFLAAPLLLLNPQYSWEDVALPVCVNATLIALLFVVRRQHLELEEKRRRDLERSERWLSTTLRSIGDAVLSADTQGRVTFMNPIAASLTGWSPEDAKGRSVEEVFDITNEYTGERVENPVRKVLREGVVVGLANHTVLRAKSGFRRPIADSGAPIVESDGDLHGVVLVFRDMTQERLLAEQLHRTQRLEALGQLAGGVAHDFNNLLTVIGSVAQFALSTTDEDSPLRPDIDSLVQATDCAISLTRQLLAFSRRQVMQPRVVRVNGAIKTAEQLLVRLLRDDVRILTQLDPDAGCVLIDPAQFEQVLVNLAINAMDAMPGGGILKISTERVLGGTELLPGAGEIPTVCIRVSDTGCGIDSEALPRIFEPFFTTKDMGRGTGLGLATVHGIVRQSGGEISVESEVGIGTTFTMVLPTTNRKEDPVERGRVRESRPNLGASRTIYLVEDEPMVRALGMRILEPLGYNVLAFSNGAEALRYYDSNPAGVDLLVTDVVMPGMSGPQLAAALRERAANLRVIFVSGYANEVVAKEGVQGNDGTFVEKPFTPQTLADAVQRRLEQPLAG